jgi:ATP-dependent protease ClpP protease subunit
VSQLTHIKEKNVKGYKTDDPVWHSHEYNIDLKSNALYLFGEDTYSDVHEGDEPGVEYVMANRFIKNLNILMRKSDEPILIHMKTCFSRKTNILTDKGNKKIVDIKIGDMVMTHKGRYRKVIDTMSHMYEGDMVTLYYGRSKHQSTKITATADHPIMVEREGKKIFVPIKDVVEDDVIFVESKDCEFTGEKVPFWRRKKNFNCDRLKRKGIGSQQSHLEQDILPFCEKLKNEGWQVVPVGAGVIPDIIGYKEGKIVAFEVEKMTGKSLEVKKQKYENAKIMEYVDDVVWHHPYNNQASKSFYTWYEYDEESGFCKVKVTSKHVKKNTYRQKVYNITVEEDHSYVANHVAVHNCGGDWSEGMAIYDALKSCPNKIIILVYTHARSMSSLILQAADKRVMMPHAVFMFHEGTLGMSGTVKQFRTEMEQENIRQKQMLDIYIDSIKKQGSMKDKKEETIRKWLIDQMNKKEDVFLSAQQAVELGFADEVFGGNGVYDWEGLKK